MSKPIIFLISLTCLGFLLQMSREPKGVEIVAIDCTEVRNSRAVEARVNEAPEASSNGSVLCQIHGGFNNQLFIFLGCMRYALLNNLTLTLPYFRGYYAGPLEFTAFQHLYDLDHFLKGARVYGLSTITMEQFADLCCVNISRQEKVVPGWIKMCTRPPKTYSKMCRVNHNWISLVPVNEWEKNFFGLVRYSSLIRDMRDSVIQELGLGEFIGVQVRRGDFKKYCSTNIRRRHLPYPSKWLNHTDIKPLSTVNDYKGNCCPTDEQLAERVCNVSNRFGVRNVFVLTNARGEEKSSLKDALSLTSLCKLKTIEFLPGRMQIPQEFYQPHGTVTKDLYLWVEMAIAGQGSHFIANSFSSIGGSIFRERSIEGYPMNTTFVL